MAKINKVPSEREQSETFTKIMKEMALAFEFKKGFTASHDLFVSPDINQKKWQKFKIAAINEFSDALDSPVSFFINEPLVLTDATLFGSGKKGIAVYADFIIVMGVQSSTPISSFSESGAESRIYAFEDINSIAFKDEGRDFVIGGGSKTNRGEDRNDEVTFSHLAIMRDTGINAFEKLLLYLNPSIKIKIKKNDKKSKKKLLKKEEAKKQKGVRKKEEREKIIKEWKSNYNPNVTLLRRDFSWSDEAILEEIAKEKSRKKVKEQHDVFFHENKLTKVEIRRNKSVPLRMRDSDYVDYELVIRSHEFIEYKPEGMRGKRAYIKIDGRYGEYLAWSGPIKIADKPKFLRGDLDKVEEESQPSEETTVQEQEVENLEVKQEKESETSDANLDKELNEKEFHKQSFFSDNKLTILPNGNLRDENYEEYELEEERGDFIVYKPEGMRGKKAYIKTDGVNYLAWSGPIKIADKSNFLRGDFEKAKEESQPIEEAPVQEQEVENIEVKQEKESETSDATTSISERLNELTKLYDEGILTKEELKKKSDELLSQM